VAETSAVRESCAARQACESQPHVGTENGVPLLRKIREALKGKVDVFETPVKEILVEDQKVGGVCLQDGTRVQADRVKWSRELETHGKNLLLIEDRAGITRGLTQASISGMVAAKELLKRETGRF
jgi:uncharacterized FAD-dependent dehydrogenase